MEGVRVIVGGRASPPPKKIPKFNQVLAQYSITGSSPSISPYRGFDAEPSVYNGIESTFFYAFHAEQCNGQGQQTPEIGRI